MVTPLAPVRRAGPVLLRVDAPRQSERPTLDQGGDDCLTATAVESLPYQATGTTIGYADDIEVPCPAIGHNAPDVFYFVTVDSTTAVDITLCQSAFDTELYLLSGSCGETVIACDDDGCLNNGGTPTASRLDSMVLQPGEQYFIVIDGVESVGGQYDLRIDLHPPCTVQPPNDSCVSVALQTLPAVMSGATRCATEDCPTFPGRHVWIGFTLPECADVELRLCGSLPVLSAVWLNLARDCDCATLSAAATLNSASCGDGNVILSWTNLAAGDYYYPLSDDSLTGGSDYQLQLLSAPCASCTLLRPSLAIDEGEPPCGPDYTDQFNGGCESLPFAFVDLAGNETVWGAAGAFVRNDSLLHDTDWYRLVLSLSADVTICFAPQHATRLVLMSTVENCDTLPCLAAASVPACSNYCETFALPVGEYYIRVELTDSSVTACQSSYILALTTDLQLPCSMLPQFCVGDVTELEPNSICGATLDPSVLGGAMTLAGTVCPIGDRDFYSWSIPAGIRATLEVHSGSDTDCLLQPAAVVLSLFDPVTCQDATGGQPPTSTGWLIDGPADVIVSVEAAFAAGSGDYQLRLSELALGVCTISCANSVTATCDSALLLNTCDGCLLYPGTAEANCEGPHWIAGPQQFARLVVTAAGEYCFTVTGDTLSFGGDVQFAIFTDCANPDSTCIFSQDVNYPGLELTGRYNTEQGCDSLWPGTYYLGVSAYDESTVGTTCGLISLVIDCGQVQIPCDTVPDLRITRSLLDGVRLFWTALHDGDYRIYSTSDLQNDGDPDEGADPAWELVDAAAAIAGAVSYTDSRPPVTFRQYVVTFHCP
ncbi:hypothetical protein HZB60_00225 [candidate division KSB1 bacterium]|nr:hypothetical protein [candidate division KSB1 bacterium]